MLRFPGNLPCIHKIIDNGIDHWISHGQPVECQVHVLNVRHRNDAFVVVSIQEIEVVWKPAQAKENHHREEHLHQLEIERLKMSCWSHNTGLKTSELTFRLLLMAFSWLRASWMSLVVTSVSWPLAEVEPENGIDFFHNTKLMWEYEMSIWVTGMRYVTMEKKMLYLE